MGNQCLYDEPAERAVRLTASYIGIMQRPGRVGQDSHAKSLGYYFPAFHPAVC